MSLFKKLQIEPNPWHRLLQDVDIAAVQVAIEAIAQDLASLDEISPGEDTEHAAATDLAAAQASLGAGHAGMALFFAYKALSDTAASSFSRDKDRAWHHLSCALSAVSETPMSPFLFFGFPGIGWVAAHLADRLFDIDEQDILQPFDEILNHHLSNAPPNARPHDYLTGLLGMGVYAAERFPNELSQNSLNILIDRLESQVVGEGNSCLWPHKAEQVPVGERERFPNGYLSLGLAHGQAAVVSFLATCRNLGDNSDRTQALLAGAVRGMIGERLPPGQESAYPLYTRCGEEPVPARAAWCHGDPGIANSLLVAATAAGEASWFEETTRLARDLGQRSAASTGVIDAGLCHGAAGLAHQLNRVYQTTGEPAIGEAARTWFRRTLDVCHPGRGMGGFQRRLADRPDGSRVFHDTPGLLNGAAGIGLALLAAVSDIEPEWDRVLLLSSPNCRLGDSELER